MDRSKTRLAVTLVLTAGLACGGGIDRGTVEARVEGLLSRMSLEEKVGQLIQADVRRVSPEDVRRYHLGSVLNGGGGFPGDDKHARPADWLALADRMYDASTDTTDGGLGIPIIWGVDAVHGHNNVVGATLFPHNIGLGAANDPELIRRIGEITAREIRVTGHDWNFGPTVAVPRDDRWGRTYEGYSEDPSIVEAYARAMVLGLQGRPGTPEFLNDHHVIATAKHFLGDGGTAHGTDQGDTRGSDAELLSIHMPGYVSALEAEVQSVMASFSSWNGTKMHTHHGLLTGTLKESMRFDGILVGDWNGHGQVPGCANDDCPASVNAGLDMFMVPDDWAALYRNTLAQVRAGQIPEARLDDAVRRILRVKARAGVLDRPRPSSRPLAGDSRVLGAPEHRAVARQAVRSSLVLLKNDGGLLPLDPSTHVLVLGDGADDIGKQSGGWTLTWQGTGNGVSDFPGATSIWDGIRTAVEDAGGRAVLSPDGSWDLDDRPSVAIAVYGEDPYAEFQGDRADVGYPRGDGRELRRLRELAAAGIPVVSVFLSGRPLWVNPELNASRAFVAAWLPGSEGGGVADVLFTRPDGRIHHDFTGRLSFSWPRRADQAVLNVGDPAYDPLFPFGFGLDYTSSEELPRLPEDGGLLAVPVGETAYFDGGPNPPWELVVEAEGHSGIRVTTGRTAPAGGAVALTVVDRRRQEDARRIAWSGTGVATVRLLTSSTPQDLSATAASGGALTFDLRVESAPSRPVYLVVEDQGGRDRRIDLSSFLTGSPEDGWTTVGIPLFCLNGPGIDLRAVSSPWGLSTDGEAVLTFSDVRLVASAGDVSACP